MCSQNKQRLLPYTILAVFFSITVAESVYSAVRTESFYNSDTFRLRMGQYLRVGDSIRWVWCKVSFCRANFSLSLVASNVKILPLSPYII